MKYEEVEVNSERWFDLTPLLNEEFRDIASYKGLYQVSNYGRIKSLKRFVKNGSNSFKLVNDKILKNINRDNKENSYMIVNLRKNNCKFFYVHRLVAKSFLKRKKYQNQINHKDGNKTNNKLDNLEWCNSSENLIHAHKTGLKKPVTGLKTNRTRPVFQFTKDKKFIKKWDYITLASKNLGISLPNIVECCKHKIPSAGGFKWEYYEERND